MHATVAKGRLKELRPSYGSHLSQQQAQEYGERILELAADTDDTLTRAHVLGDAIDPDSPLHEYFEWDDEQAAHQYRLSQASYLLRSIEKVVVKEDGQEVTVPITVNIKIEITDEDPDPWPGAPHHRGFAQAYSAIDAAMSDPRKREYLLKQALRDAESYMNKHAVFEDDELRDIFEAIRRTIKRLLSK